MIGRRELFARLFGGALAIKGIFRRRPHVGVDPARGRDFTMVSVVNSDGKVLAAERLTPGEPLSLYDSDMAGTIQVRGRTITGLQPNTRYFARARVVEPGTHRPLSDWGATVEL